MIPVLTMERIFHALLADCRCILIAAMVVKGVGKGSIKSVVSLRCLPTSKSKNEEPNNEIDRLSRNNCHCQWISIRSVIRKNGRMRYRHITVIAGTNGEIVKARRCVTYRFSRCTSQTQNLLHGCPILAKNKEN